MRCGRSWQPQASAPRSTTRCRCTCSSASATSVTGRGSFPRASTPRPRRSPCQSIPELTEPQLQYVVDTIAAHYRAEGARTERAPASERTQGEAHERSRRPPDPAPASGQSCRPMPRGSPHLPCASCSSATRGASGSFSRGAAGLLMDFSRQRLDEIALAKLLQLADAVQLRARIDAMWRGEHINATEDRAVLHVALRQPPGAAIGGAAHREAGHGRARAHAGLRRRRARRHDPRQRPRAVHAGGQHRHRRLRPGAGDGSAGAARLQHGARRVASSYPTSTACTSRKCCSGPIRAPRSSSSAPRPSPRSRRKPTRTAREPG